jgi:hypothetical protein
MRLRTLIHERRAPRAAAILLALCAAASSSGCSAIEQLSSLEEQYIKLSEDAVGRFHEQFNAENYQMICNQTGGMLKQADYAEFLVKELSENRQRLGQVKSAKQSDVNVRYTTGGLLIHLTYDTEFTNGSATEFFNFGIKDGKALLESYDIKPRQLPK